MAGTERIGRYWPDQPLPPYAYVPGRTPHPQRDAGGHGVQLEPAGIVAVDPADWRTSAAFCYGVDLFNAGYPWEAHEAWEDLWRAYPGGAPAGIMLTGLIKLAAAGVKARVGNARGVARTLAKGDAIFAGLDAPEVLGLSPPALRAAIATVAPATCAETGTLDLSLAPGDSSAGGVRCARPPRA
jgi:hypothetical protein